MENTARDNEGLGVVEEDTQKDKYLTFSLAEEVYAIDICYVIEIIGILKITKVPDMPPFIKGVINLRGKVIPVMDVRARFGLPARDYDERTCVVVVNVADNAMGLVVDHVNEVMDIPAGQVEPSPAANGHGGGKYVKGIGKIDDEVKILLEVECLVK
ncbi:scaffold protein CheW associated with MCPs of class 36H [Syntrophotalea carbinolica DSM 2380]|uniref:Chemotaxis protein CheW n=1 Tax=Syntrophotalea carbinolica (strain DSM 2380 / NBRC 103641 / GraBd1) TaxID=338963 RepID=Q3A205_SYNC1|nr:chemotaxis protein CheW [Syntrophotalea carbinolica]ABA89602.1 scaffold protein CheW associated with MCPs of class 36H [Syntrophotalea carbinolica DSM 2380]